MEAWTPVLTNIALLIIASVHCLVCVASIYHLSKRVCPCFRAKQPFDHNQFDPNCKQFDPHCKQFDPHCKQYVVHVDERQERAEKKGQELSKELEAKLQGETLKKKKVCVDMYL